MKRALAIIGRGAAGGVSAFAIYIAAWVLAGVVLQIARTVLSW